MATSFSRRWVRAGQLCVEFTITLEAGGVLSARGMHVCFRAHDREAFHARAARVLEFSHQAPSIPVLTADRAISRSSTEDRDYNPALARRLCDCSPAQLVQAAYS
jgi:hypothetical protein